jgi:hypothetical protein
MLRARLAVIGRGLQQSRVDMEGRSADQIVAQYRGYLSLKSRADYQALPALAHFGYLPPRTVYAYVDHDGDTTVLGGLVNYLDSFPARLPAPHLHLTLEVPVDQFIQLAHPRQRSVRTVVLLLERAAARGARSITVESALGSSLVKSRDQVIVQPSVWKHTTYLTLNGTECLPGGNLWEWARTALKQPCVQELSVDTRNAGASSSTSFCAHAHA